MTGTFRTPLLFLLVTTLAGAAEAPLTGTWDHGNPEKGGGVLRVIEEAGEIRFQIELWRGAPSYNMGWLEGKLSVKDAKASFVKREADWICQIDFVFDGTKATLHQVEGAGADCGFGHGVSADGVFVRKSQKKPAFQGRPQ